MTGLDAAAGQRAEALVHGADVGRAAVVDIVDALNCGDGVSLRIKEERRSDVPPRAMQRFSSRAGAASGSGMATAVAMEAAKMVARKAANFMLNEAVCLIEVVIGVCRGGWLKRRIEVVIADGDEVLCGDEGCPSYTLLILLLSLSFVLLAPRSPPLLSPLLACIRPSTSRHRASQPPPTPPHQPQHQRFFGLRPTSPRPNRQSLLFPVPGRGSCSSSDPGPQPLRGLHSHQAGQKASAIPLHLLSYSSISRFCGASLPCIAVLDLGSGGIEWES
ncbi:hypothetical protein IWX90DRAFT_56942 [Phyllosticta citrichinensis]|uniref:Uncharacterized protein n=1 Tax=Phyllosticta citrichinensis TaxID=1130410 RepID=A0ABR1XIS3_9PEZI